MDQWIEFVSYYAPHAHWMFFIMLMLAGLNIPFSEDIILLTGGTLAATCIPEQYFQLYIWLFIGCWVSAWEAYWIGRALGPKLYEYSWFQWIITPAQVEKLRVYYEKFGIWTFIVGRFCPGGIRNALFMSSGLTHMPFRTFIIRDGIACLISSFTIFSIGFTCAENYKSIATLFQKYSWNAFLLIIISLSLLLVWTKIINPKKATT